MVAIKLLKKEALDESSLGRFLDEARTLAHLTHPNLPAIYDLGKDDGEPFVVLEFIDGGDVAHVLESSPDHRLPPRDILRIAAGTCRALDHAHGADVLHRDIKPENIMLATTGEVKLTDFGLASRGTTAVSEAGVIVGTVAYLAPEAATGHGSQPRSDLYSLGAVMYQMAVGRPPFLGNDEEVIYGHIHDAPAPPRSVNPDVPPSLETLILRLMAKNPDHRPSSAAAVLKEITDLEGSLTTSVEPERARAPAPAVVAPRLVDRSTELARLREAVTKLASGQGGVLMLTGQAGIGKTRMAAELSSLALRDGISFMTGHASEGEGAPPLAPWIEALRGFVLTIPPQLLYKLVGIQAAVLARILPDLPTRLGPALPSATAPPGLERFQLFDAITQLLVNASKESPFVLFLDDLHWADEATIQLLEYASRNAVGHGILFLGSYRPEDVVHDGPLESALHELNRARRLEQIHLTRLGPKDVQVMIANTLHTDKVDAKLATVVNERAGGNPFFVEELVLALRDEGHIVIENGSASWKGGSVRLPDSVHHLVQRRLARLSRPAQELLLKASILGRRIRPEALSRLTGLERDAMLDLIDEALRSGLLAEEASGTETSLVFGDPQIRDCLYESISQIRRQRLHGLAAEAVAAMPYPSAEELAHHYAMAALPEPARRYLESAGDEAIALSSSDRAAERFERALSFWPPEERDSRRRLLEKLGDAYSDTGKWRWARESYLEARALIRDAADDVPIAVRLGQALWYLGDVPAARAELERALGALGHAETSEAADALNWLATILLDEGDPEAARQRAERALEIAKKVGDRIELGFALNNLWVANAVACHWEMSGLLLAQQLELTKKGGALYDLGNAYDDVSVYYTYFLPDYPRALESDRQAIDIAQRIGNRPAEVRWRLHRGWTLRDMGRWDEAEREAAAILAIAEESYQHFCPWIHLFRGQLAGLRGDLTGAAGVLRLALDSADQETWWRLHFESQAHAALAWVQVEAKDLAAARSSIRNACAARDRHRCGWCGDLTCVVQASAETMDSNGDSALFREAVDQAHQRGTSIAKAVVVHLEAKWKRLHGSPSVEGLAGAQAYLQKIGRRFDLAGTIHERALTVNALGRSSEGNALLEEGLRIFVDLGAKIRVEDVLRSMKLLKA